jgi:carbon-monoxide dehydrogenase medium subunit
LTVYVPDVELHEAATLKQAATLMARYGPDARLLAGGTDLLVDLKTGRIGVRHLVSINRIDSLRGVSRRGNPLGIGALTTVTELDRSPIVRRRFSPILDATRRMAAVQVRNAATVGGNIASAVPCADLPPILIAMHASVVLWSPGGRREAPLETFITGARRTILRPDEILIKVLIPKPPAGFGAAYARFQLRDGNAIAVAAVAASLTLDSDGLIRDARVVLGAVAPVPVLVEEAGVALTGRRPGEEAFRLAADAAMRAAEPISDIRGSAEYRRQMVGVMTGRALARAYDRSREAQ